MSSKVYWEIYFHIVWHTKTSVPMINDRIEQRLHKFLTHRILQNPESIVHAIGGIEDHLHMAVSIPPTIAVSDFVGDLKGSSSHALNHAGFGPHALHWQVGYGVVTFGKGDLPWVVEYIRNQRSHHYNGTIADRMERITHIETGPFANDDNG